jgi:hypothetical protein
MLLCALSEAREGVPIGLLKSSSSAASSEDPQMLEDLNDLLEKEWNARLTSTHAAIDQAEERRSAIESHRLCDGVLTAASFVPSLALQASGGEHIQIEGTGESARWVSLLHQSHHRSLNVALDRILQKDPNERGLVLREQWRPFPPTWKSSLKKQREVLARGCVTWFELTRQDVALLLTLEDFVQASRSSDICDSVGRPVPDETVRAFISEQICPATWPLLQELTKSEASVDGNVVQTDETEIPPAYDIPLSLVESVMRRLRVASVDRVIREVRRMNPMHGRATVIESLKSMGPTIKWHGRNIVAMEETA